MIIALISILGIAAIYLFIVKPGRKAEDHNARIDDRYISSKKARS